MKTKLKTLSILILLLNLINPDSGFSQEKSNQFFKDRGKGLATSMFGTYVEKGELLIYPFFEYTYDHDREYQPEQLGFKSGKDFTARYKSTQVQLFLAYGISEWLALELEAAYLNAVFDKSKVTCCLLGGL